MITAVTTCMGRREHLEMTLPLMLEEFDDVVVVDWSCPEHSGKWAKSLGAEVVFRPDEKYFHPSKARNLGARQVKSRSLCFLDADTLVMPGLKNEIEGLLNLSSLIIAPRTSQNTDIHSLGGFIAVDIGHFWGVNGYDETLKGYALEDCHLKARLVLDRGLTPKRVSQGCLAAIRHSNALRGQYHKDPIGLSANRNYNLLAEYYKSKGIEDWSKDPRTCELAYRPERAA